MFIIGTALYAALTIIFVPILLVFSYMLIVNNRYKDIINVFNVETSTILGGIGIAIALYVFLTGFCIGDLPVIWTSTVFIACFVGSLILSITICKIVKFYNRDRIKYANILLADKQICDKLAVGSQQLNSLKTIMNQTSYSVETKEYNKQQIKELQDVLNKLVEIHQELQQQKILMNASLSTSEMKHVVLSDNSSVNKALNKEKDKISSRKLITDNYSSVRNLMNKYNV